MLSTLARLEETSLSLLLRESGLAFFTALSLHSLAMAFVVGINIAVCLRLLGAMPGVVPGTMAGFYRLHWWAVALVFLSGLALLLAYPAKALTNEVFWLKLVALSLALALARRAQRGLSAQGAGMGPLLASCALMLWAVTLFAGRFLAYTHEILLASRFY